MKRGGKLKTEIERLQNLRIPLEARVAYLKDKINGQSGDEHSSDPLAELSALPPVLDNLRKCSDNKFDTELDALEQVQQHLEKLGLTYPQRVVRAFHTAMKVNETTQMAVLAGISGTGKSQLPRRYAEAMGIGFLQVSVQPRWDSPQGSYGILQLYRKPVSPN